MGADSLANVLRGNNDYTPKKNKKNTDFFTPKEIKGFLGEKTHYLGEKLQNEVIDENNLPITISGKYNYKGNEIEFNAINKEIDTSTSLIFNKKTTKSEINRYLKENLKSIKINIKENKSLLSLGNKPSVDIFDQGGFSNSGELKEILIKYLTVKYNGIKYLKIINGNLSIDEKNKLKDDYFKFVKDLNRKIKGAEDNLDLQDYDNDLIRLNIGYQNENISLSQVSIPGDGYDNERNIDLNLNLVFNN